ncbi:hypothetical protein HaLaN_11290, partial [Haematococcus lacustris]
MAEQTSQHPALDASLDIASAEATLYLRPDQAGNVVDLDSVYKRLQNAAAEQLSAECAAPDSSDVKGTTGSTQASDAEVEVVDLQAMLAACCQEALARLCDLAAQNEQLNVALQQAKKEVDEQQAAWLADQRVIVDQE